ncbi:MAG TPA: FAD-dependent oxidoreductase [Blastocatellia bacterium]
MPKATLEDSRDVVVIGAGVTGLWTAALLRSNGYSTAVLERNALGTGQTILSQGIVHAGIKYALTEQVKDTDLSISDMPAIWSSCLEGKGEIDLSSVSILSRSQYIWPAPGFASMLTTKIASKALRSASIKVDEKEIPDILKKVAGRPIFEAAETIIDAKSLLAALSDACASPIIKVSNSTRFEIEKPGVLKIIDSNPPNPEANIRFRFLVLSAGAGNAGLVDRIRVKYPEMDAKAPSMQLRPLKMVVVRQIRNGRLPSLFGHCISPSTTPLITVTTHEANDQNTIWYLGGGLAEQGVKLSDFDQITEAKKILNRCVPGIRWESDDYQWATVYCERAEVRTSTGARPSGPFIATYPGISVAWPTKLTLAPATARKIISDIAQQGIHPSKSGFDSPLYQMEKAPVARPPWEGTST